MRYRLSEWLPGAWERKGRRLEGGSFEEPSEVLWLCAPPVYADLRQYLGTAAEAHELDQTQAFGGKVRVNGDIVTWEHDLDTTDRYAEGVDRAPLRGSRRELLEIGDGYQERWVQTAPSDAVIAAAERRDADNQTDVRVVRVDKRAIAIFSHPTPVGIQLHSVDGQTWQLHRSTGVATDADVRIAAEIAAILPDGSLPVEWIVCG